jgi:hypothetical protein
MASRADQAESRVSPACRHCHPWHITCSLPDRHDPVTQLGHAGAVVPARGPRQQPGQCLHDRVQAGQSHPQAGQAATDYQVVGGVLGESNVNAVRTMVEMIDMLRKYETAQRAYRPKTTPLVTRATTWGDSSDPCPLQLSVRDAGAAAQSRRHREQPVQREHRGLQRTRVDFQDPLYQTIRTPGTVGSQGTTIPTRERPAGAVT